MISNLDVYYLTGAFNQHFDFFSKPILVYRNISISPDAQSNIYGFNNQENNFDYSQEVITISGMRHYPERNPTNNATTKTSSLQNKTYIKVRESGSNYIREAPISKIEMEGVSYNLTVNAPTIQDYLGLKFYIFELERSA